MIHQLLFSRSFISIPAAMILFASSERSATYGSFVAVCAHLGFDYAHAVIKLEEERYSAPAQCSKTTNFNDDVIQQLLMQSGDVESNPGPKGMLQNVHTQ